MLSPPIPAISTVTLLIFPLITTHGPACTVLNRRAKDRIFVLQSLSNWNRLPRESILLVIRTVAGAAEYMCLYNLSREFGLYCIITISREFEA